MEQPFFFCLEHPLHRLPAPSQVRNANLRQFPQLVAELGGNPSRILEHHGLDPAAIEGAENFVDCRVLVEVLEFCATSLHQPLFGLQLAQIQDTDVYGFVLALCRAAPTLRQALEHCIDYIPLLHCSESVLELAEGRNMTEFRWAERSDLGLNNQASLHGLLLNLKFMRAVGGASFRPAYVSLPVHLGRGKMAVLEQFLGCSVRRDPDRGCIAFPSSLLQTSTAGVNGPLHQLLNGYLSQLKAASRLSLVDRVHAWVRESLGQEQLSVGGCAQALGMSTRTLQAHLQSQGVSFSHILDGHRLRRARHLLRHSDIPVAELSDMLGYAERTSFARAFKRWTGVTPREFRVISPH